jgi:hypothetical protein
MEAVAFPSSALQLSCANLLPEQAATLQVLQQAGHCSEVCLNGPGWQLTQAGLHANVICFQLSNPRPLISIQDGVPLCERSPYALLDYLEKSGWTLHEWPYSYDPDAHEVLAPGAERPRDFYIRLGNKTLDRYYLAVLAMLQDVSHCKWLNTQHVNFIQHFMPSQWYKSLVCHDALAVEHETISFFADGGVRRQGHSDRLVRFAFVASHCKKGQLTGRQGRLNNMDSFHWGCVTFAACKEKTKADGTVTSPPAMRCYCPRRSHASRNAKGRLIWCTASCQYNSFEEKGKAIQYLKAWILHGMCPEVRTRGQHKKFKLGVEVRELDALELEKPGSDRELSPSEDGGVSRKRRAHGRKACRRGSAVAAARGSGAASSSGVVAPPLPPPQADIPFSESGSHSSPSSANDSDSSSDSTGSSS